MDTDVAKDDAARQRIITHMNEDHGDSIARYLEHYCKLSRWAACGGRMSNINLDEMVLECEGKTHRIPLAPPMDSFREARERLSAMDKDTLQGLDRSDITVKEFVPPTGFYAPVFLVIAATFAAYSRRSGFDRGQIFERYSGSGFAKVSWTIQPWLLALLVVLHSAELIYFMRHHLRYHSVNIRSSVYWKWVATTFIEGQFAFYRFKSLVRRKRGEKQKQKH